MSSDGHDGIIWLLGSLIVLTLAAVLLSILVDQRFSFQRQTNSVQTRLIVNGEKISQLKGRIDDYEERLAFRKITAESNSNRNSELEAANSVVSMEMERLLERKTELMAAIPDLEKDLARYREEYRSATWRNAVGEKFDHLFLRTGRQFDKVIITKVTDDGLEISHASGLARIDGADLSRAIRERFQWDQ